MLDIRNASLNDLEEINRLEQACFSPEEAASRTVLKERLETFPNHFWLLERDGRLVAMVNGMTTDNEFLADEMYANAAMHNEDGKWQMMFGVETDPEYRHRGYASILMKEAIKDCREDSRSGIILTCKEEHIPFYEKLGFVNKGVADSAHAGKTWYLMQLDLQP
ncbi:GNAT family N-acetyltransferase [Ileibacterium valens]|uniref:GNAT family N-acetyltransferase n=1 Tax=Ileibacterium valens TaxID=1862668 RepID=A0A1U7NG85_9FIRM|nr:GNAT family N-acetyltransferase [Ileibacterium valens]OLU38695.1 GNAT family N-acetyltransferase [Erysipelotrichaceae bacterium NYU-BL-F16]OLU39910.1 GNAT family N-acetyltransferase [Ileibacterium valens]OLU41494.1 GNAT family N-acetyltransferase [Erysipelotrichaceae bacterium NYU-BL-E8]